ncbi:MAG: hypothetical protein JKY41_03275 [Rhodobacteraceae bacterium]|nr:hypothetical protein [Paracoccaceae bacterium]
MTINKVGLIKIAAFIFAFAPFHASAFGNDNIWVSGWGQGISEALITKGPGNQIYATCGEGHTGIRFMLLGNAPTGHSVLLTFDNDDPVDVSIWEGMITSNCHACAGTYQSVVQKLRKHNSVHVRFENGDNTRFTLNGSSNAIVECVSDFAR